jgi:hypothetical protein
MKNTTKTIFYSLIFFLALNCHVCYSAEMTTQPWYTTTPSLKEIAAAVAVPGAYAGLTIELYYVAKGTKSLLLPTKEEQIHVEEVEKEIKSFDAKKEFRSCLMKHRATSERGPSGLPSACEEAALMFAVLGKREEVKKMTETFNHYRK